MKFSQEAMTWAVLSLEIALRGRDRTEPKLAKMTPEDEAFLEKLTEELTMAMGQLADSLDTLVTNMR